MLRIRLLSIDLTLTGQRALHCVRHLISRNHSVIGECVIHILYHHVTVQQIVLCGIHLLDYCIACDFIFFSIITMSVLHLVNFKFHLRIVTCELYSSSCVVVLIRNEFEIDLIIRTILSVLIYKTCIYKDLVLINNIETYILYNRSFSITGYSYLLCSTRINT